MTKELEKKVEQAIKLIQSASKNAERDNEPLEVCFSGGKDSEVILELTKMSGIKNYVAVYKNTTIDPPKTLVHVRSKGVEVRQPTISFINLIKKAGYPNRFKRFCCSYLKEYKVYNNAIVGIRKCESTRRAERYKEPVICRYTERKREHINQYLPILDWTDDDVVEFIKERNIQCHPLYYDENGDFHVERRLGCLCCPMMRKKRILEFKKYPKMINLYIKYGQIYLDTHRHTKAGQRFKTSYEWFCANVFADNLTQYYNKFGQTLFDDGVDCKAYIENYFNIKFK